MEKSRFNTLCDVLPEGNHWWDYLTPELADAFYEAGFSAGVEASDNKVSGEPTKRDVVSAIVTLKTLIDFLENSPRSRADAVGFNYAMDIVKSCLKSMAELMDSMKAGV